LNEQFLKLKQCYAEIIQGYSEVEHDGKKIYIKHYTEKDLLKTDLLYEGIYNKAKSRGLFTVKEKTKLLQESEEWTKEQEDKLQELNVRVSNLQTSISNIFIKAQRKGLEEKLNESQKEQASLIKEKNECFGETCESYTSKIQNQLILKDSLYKDSKFSKKLLSEKQYDELDSTEFSMLIVAQSMKFSNFNEDTISQIGVCPFFLNSFMSCKSNPFIFYGKPIIELTIFQQTLFHKGLFAKSILELGKTPPNDISQDPKKLADWYEAQAQQEKAKNKRQGGESMSDPSSSSEKTISAKGTSYINATKEEMKQIAKDEGAEPIDLVKEAKRIMKETGKKKLDSKDLAKIHGLI